MSNVRIHAEQAAERVDSSEVGLDPIAVITIIAAVIPKLIECFRQYDEPDQAMVQLAVKKANERHPQQLHRRTTRVVMQKNRTLDRSQASAIADAIIEQALESTGPAVAACCAEIDD
jgi:hypothetical protein